MKQSVYLLSLLIVTMACEQKAQLVLQSSLENIDQKRVVLTRAAFGQLSKPYFSLRNAQGELVPLQFDDLDGDGSWDEVAFEVSFETSQVALDIEPLEEDALPEFPVLTDVYLGHSPQRNGQFQSVSYTERPSDHVALSTPYLYQYEGPGWESDLVAFRTYFDSRNGKDIFGKTKPALQVTKIGLEGNYHELADWGMDVLKVGSSLGAGALAMYKNDSLYRLGDTDLAAFKVITEGPVRSVFELRYDGWEVAGATYGVTETISIWAGKRSYSSVVSLKGGQKDTLVSGIVNLKNLEAKQIEEERYAVNFTHGKQSENNDELGMALLVPKAGSAGFGSAPDEGEGVTNTYTALLKPVNDSYEYHFYAGWVLENQAFKDASAFEAALRAEARALSAKVSVVK